MKNGRSLFGTLFAYARNKLGANAEVLSFLCLISIWNIDNVNPRKLAMCLRMLEISPVCFLVLRSPGSSSLQSQVFVTALNKSQEEVDSIAPHSSFTLPFMYSLSLTTHPDSHSFWYTPFRTRPFDLIRMTNPAEKPETFHSQTGPLSPIRGAPFRDAPASVVLRVDGGAGRHEPIHRGGVAFLPPQDAAASRLGRGGAEESTGLWFSPGEVEKNVERSWFKSTWLRS